MKRALFTAGGALAAAVAASIAGVVLTCIRSADAFDVDLTPPPYPTIPSPRSSA